MKNIFVKNLLVKNFAIFEDLSLDFSSDFNVIVGETGSGKSLLINALNIISGGKSEKKYIKEDADFAMIEATFICHDEDFKNFLHEQGFPFTEEIIIKRIFSHQKAGKAFLNHSSCSLKFLKSLTEKMFNFSGQFENQKLLDLNYQISLLDQYAHLQKDVLRYREKYLTTKELLKTQNTLILKREDLLQKQDYLQFQYDEIEKINPSIEEEKSLNEDYRILAKKMTQQEQWLDLQSLLEGGNQGKGFLTLLESIAQTISQLELNTLEEKISDFREFTQQLSYLCAQNSADEDLHEKIEHLNSRINEYQKIKRKHHVNTSELLELQEKFRQELAQIHDIEEKINDLKSQYLIHEKELEDEAEKLHQKRLKQLPSFVKKINEKIHLLGMEQATFKIETEALVEKNVHGKDRIEFFIETNPGSGFKSLAEIASGGELSRVLLATRSILPTQNHQSLIYIFDEIDTGISGTTADKVGVLLNDLASQHQIIAISHLPQVAQHAHQINFLTKGFEKEKNHSRVKVNVDILTQENKQKAISSMLEGLQ